MATRGTVVYSPGFIFLPLVLCKYQFLPRDSLHQTLRQQTKGLIMTIMQQSLLLKDHFL